MGLALLLQIQGDSEGLPNVNFIRIFETKTLVPLAPPGGLIGLNRLISPNGIPLPQTGQS